MYNLVAYIAYNKNEKFDLDRNQINLINFS